MRVLFGFPGWGWKMYGLASFSSGHMWFIGFSKQLPTASDDTTAQDLSKCPQCSGEADNGHDRDYPPTAYLCSKCNTTADKRREEGERATQAATALIGAFAGIGAGRKARKR